HAARLSNGALREGMDSAFDWRLSCAVCLFHADRTNVTKRLRTALIWMLMLALPAQGMAALAMQVCGVSVAQGAVGAELQTVAAHHSVNQSPHAEHAVAEQQQRDGDTGSTTGKLC